MAQAHLFDSLFRAYTPYSNYRPHQSSCFTLRRAHDGLGLVITTWRAKYIEPRPYCTDHLQIRYDLDNQLVAVHVSQHISCGKKVLRIHYGRHDESRIDWLSLMQAYPLILPEEVRPLHQAALETLLWLGEDCGDTSFRYELVNYCAGPVQF